MRERGYEGHCGIPDAGEGRRTASTEGQTEGNDAPLHLVSGTVTTCV